MHVTSKPPLTDSPWFWVLLFSVVGLVSLVVISGQYGKRQARIERQYQARERIGDNAVNDPTRPEYATPDNTLVPIWPLGVLLVATAVGSAIMLQRERSRVAPVASTGVAQPPEAS
jgi:hypothetical protein